MPTGTARQRSPWATRSQGHRGWGRASTEGEQAEEKGRRQVHRAQSTKGEAENTTIGKTVTNDEKAAAETEEKAGIRRDESSSNVPLGSAPTLTQARSWPTQRRWLRIPSRIKQSGLRPKNEKKQGSFIHSLRVSQSYKWQKGRRRQHVFDTPKGRGWVEETEDNHPKENTTYKHSTLQLIFTVDMDKLPP